jgi:hypothetical protein
MMFDYEGIEKAIGKIISDPDKTAKFRETYFGTDAFGNRYNPITVTGSVTGRFTINQPSPQPLYRAMPPPMPPRCMCSLCVQLNNDVETPLHPAARDYTITQAVKREQEFARLERMRREELLRIEMKLADERKLWVW